MAKPALVTALVLSGGGARAAYQAGALRGIAAILGKRRKSPFPVISGTSAGAINAATLAIHADEFRLGVARLVRWWRRIGVDDVYRADFATLSLHGARFLASIVGVGSPPADAASMLDSAPLGTMLERVLEFDRLDGHLKSGALSALAVNATSYATGQAVTFFQGGADFLPWQRTRRRGERCRITHAHLMASAAIPFIFPAMQVGEDFFMDGSVRQIAPLSPALHLEAQRIVVIAVGQFAGQTTVTPGPPQYPSFAQVAGHALSSIFLDNLGADLERMMQLNRIVGMVPKARLAKRGVRLRNVDALVLAPGSDLGPLALRFADRLPHAVRTLLHGFGSTRGTGANLLSYLLFDRGFCRALLDLGYNDTMARKDEIAAFLDPARTTFIPLYWPPTH